LVHKLILIAAILGLLGFNNLRTHEQANHENSSLLFVNGWLFKALSGPAHNLVADGLWLVSNGIAEIRNSTNAVDARQVREASKAILALDPYFFRAHNYTATLLASIFEDTSSATTLMRTARHFDSNNFLLYFNEILFWTTYAYERANYDYIRKLAKDAAMLPEAQKVVGPLDVKDLIEEILIDATHKSHQTAQALADLAWLKEQTTSIERKKVIQKRIEALQNPLE